jgi:hypothetical protein|tara:strand:+ start:165 stop:419 length:255 start_codon:yes stop_codon:yes gene_type:complete
MVIFKTLFVVILWTLVLSNCATTTPVDNIPEKIKDTNGNLHYYTMYRLTSFQQPVKYCELHQEWEYVEYMTNHQRAMNTEEVIN